MKNVHLYISWLAAILLAGCNLHNDSDPDSDDFTTAAESELHTGTSFRIQAGATLSTLGVTDDGYALYWEGGSVYATRLFPGAQRELVATEVNQPPLTMIVGRTALLWTATPFFAGPSISPLVVWTSKHGPKRASDASWAPALGAIAAQSAVCPDGRQILFTSNVSSDGSTGDVVRASTDLSQVTTLVAGVSAA